LAASKEITMRKYAFIAAVIAMSVPSSAALAGPDGVWRCKASGNIPIALLTISGSSYKMQAVSNTVWALKPNDRSNGSGTLNIRGNSITAASGPLADIYGISGTYCDPAAGGQCTQEALLLNSTKSIPLGCWRGG
jgi:type IV secretory pathway protease TraF